MTPAATRWVIYGGVLALALVAGRIAEQPEGRVAAARPRAQVEPAAAGAPRLETAQASELDLNRLARRVQSETGADLFDSRSWAELEAEEARRNAPPPPPPPPQAPPLPFAFMGKLIDDGRMIVFLTKGDRNYIVRTGDTIDGTYRVEEIGESGMTLTYLPLDSRQSLAVGSPALPASAAIYAPATTPAGPPSAAASPGALAEPARLVWIAPAHAEIGEEFTIEVGLPTGPQPRSGRVELVYDPRVLAVLGGAAASGSGATTRRAIVDVIGPGFPGAPPTPSEVRFRVLAADPTKTQIGIENLSAVAGGSPLAVASPATHPLAIVQAGGLRSKSN